VPESPSPGRYPPEHVWRFPPPPLSRGWLVAAITSGVLGLVVLGGAMTYLSINANRDIPGFIDDPEVVEVAVEECRLMRSSIKGLPFEGSREDRLDALSDQNTAIRHMVSRIRSVERGLRTGDQPLDDWLSDWEALASGRDDYIDRQRRGIDSRFRVPRSPDGDPINERMDTAGAEICTVPKTLLRPDLAGAQRI
jgi:hypothetical protein